MATYYVATDGSDGGDGSSTSPWKTISHAMASSSLQPGDTVLVRPGTYDEPYGVQMAAGSAAGDITLKSEVPHEALIRTDSFAAVRMANYTTLEGFDISADGHGVFNDELHHITMRNNVVHDCGNSGLGAMHSDFITIEGNEIYNCASKTWDSGISIYEPRNITGDTSTDGYRIIIRNNISHDNFQEGGPFTDGNGIIMDDFHNDQMAGGGNYQFQSLVDGNVVYNNGGKGIAVHWSDNVTVSNNTAYHNNQDNKNTATYKGELSQWDGDHNTWINNIAVADTGVNGTNQGISVGGGSTDTTFTHNITYSGSGDDAVYYADNGAPLTIDPADNMFGVNPDLANPANGNFELTSDSPAIDAGTAAYGLSGTDVDGDNRVVGTVDIGAQESSATPADTGGTDTGGGTTGGTDTAGGGTGGTDTGGTGTGGTDTGGGTTGGTDTAGGSTGGTDTGGTDTGGGTTGGTDTAGGGTDTGGGPADPVTTSIWDAAATPAVEADPDTNSVELGLRFEAQSDTVLQGLEVYRAPGNTDDMPATVWSADGEKLATASFDGDAGSGWQQVTLDQAVDLVAGESYVVSYHAPNGTYAASEGYFQDSQDAGAISIGPDAGVYAYGGTSALPEDTWHSSNYWIDVVLGGSDASGGETVTPTDTAGTDPQPDSPATDPAPVVTDNGSTPVDAGTVDSGTVDTGAGSGADGFDFVQDTGWQYGGWGSYNGNRSWLADHQSYWSDAGTTAQDPAASTDLAALGDALASGDTTTSADQAAMNLSHAPLPADDFLLV